jgi:hypothetical protein
MTVIEGELPVLRRRHFGDSAVNWLVALLLSLFSALDWTAQSGAVTLVVVLQLLGAVE